MGIIEVNGLARTVQSRRRRRACLLCREQGEIFGFLGPDGAGKSTTINMLATILLPTGGDALVNGFSIRRHRNDVRRSVGLVFQDPSLDDRLTVEENLRFHARLCSMPHAECTGSRHAPRRQRLQVESG